MMFTSFGFLLSENREQEDMLMFVPLFLSVIYGQKWTNTIFSSKLVQFNEPSSCVPFSLAGILYFFPVPNFSPVEKTNFMMVCSTAQHVVSTIALNLPYGE